MADGTVTVFAGAALAAYAFGHGHPFSPLRHDAFLEELRRSGVADRVEFAPPVQASREQIESFHTHDYVDRVRACSATGRGMLDMGDTPAFPGVFEAAATVVGTSLAAVDRLMSGTATRAFVPIAGLHHATRDSAAGFCVFNDCGVAIEALRRVHGVRRVAYVDIDAHHGDGVFYAFEDDPDLIFVDLHQDGRTLYPGTGGAEETGVGPARGAKLNIPMAPGSDDRAFFQAWEQAEAFIEAAAPEFILLQCGADSLAGDPLTGLRYTEAAHAHAAKRLRAIADRHAGGRLLALGGGGYDLDNLARAWTAVVREMADIQKSRQESIF